MGCCCAPVVLNLCSVGPFTTQKLVLSPLNPLSLLAPEATILSGQLLSTPGVLLRASSRSFWNRLHSCNKSVKGSLRHHAHNFLLTLGAFRSVSASSSQRRIDVVPAARSFSPALPPCLYCGPNPEVTPTLFCSAHWRSI